MSTHNDTASSTAEGAGSAEFLTFALGEEEYGVDILTVQEIRGYDSVTRLPDAPDYIKGVINLRGTIVPVVDMRLKFRLPRAEYTPVTVMIVLNVGERVVGMVEIGRHTSELQSRENLVCRLLLEKKNSDGNTIFR